MRLLGLLAVVLLAAAPGPAAAAKSGQAKPTIVLVHGAWADSSSWSGVVERLQRRGYTVRVPPNPLRGLSGDSAHLAGYLGAIAGPIVLVGHSYGGAVITNAATGDSDVKALVYIGGFAPDHGETVVQLATARPGSAVGGDPATVFDTVPIPGAPGDVDLYVEAERVPERVRERPAGENRRGAGRRPTWNLIATSRSKSSSLNASNGLAICVPASVTPATNAPSVSVAPVSSCSATALRLSEAISSTTAAASSACDP